jgi:hypothetical protein
MPWTIYEWTKFSHQKRDAEQALRPVINQRLSALRVLRDPLPHNAFDVVGSNTAIDNILRAAGSVRRHNTIENRILEDRINDHWRIFFTADGNSNTINCILIGHLNANNTVEQY